MGRRDHPGGTQGNWFRTGEDGKFMWPGFGENLRVLDWIIKRCRKDIDAVETPIGYVPAPDAINIEGLDLPDEVMEKLLDV
ncbi:MAG: phosphoenolpyruvate carboxykinase (GTP), partial [Planctomycetia bacterium]|nr:phosphoenolpyruvate carboxykinase (GTP) [Planctomycetia bacterium]